MWRPFGLQPHRADAFKPSTDPLFAEKVRDIVEFYIAPPDRALVVCVEEKSRVQALERDAATDADPKLFRWVESANAVLDSVDPSCLHAAGEQPQPQSSQEISY